jgi:hypothetical protein
MIKVELTNRRWAMLAPVLFLGACAGPKLADYAATTPPLVLEQALVGESTAYGIFESRSGKLQRRFVVDVTGTWDAAAQVLMLDERFRFDDGQTDQRIWKFKKTADGAYIGTAGDVVGEARVAIAGAAATFTYKVDLKVGDGSVRVRFRDWLYRIDQDVIVNRAKVTKFGLRVGEVTVVFTPPGA